MNIKVEEERQRDWYNNRDTIFHQSKILIPNKNVNKTFISFTATSTYYPIAKEFR